MMHEIDIMYEIYTYTMALLHTDAYGMCTCEAYGMHTWLGLVLDWLGLACLV